MVFMPCGEADSRVVVSGTAGACTQYFDFVGFDAYKADEANHETDHRFKGTFQHVAVSHPMIFAFGQSCACMGTGASASFSHIQPHSAVGLIDTGCRRAHARKHA